MNFFGQKKMSSEEMEALHKRNTERAQEKNARKAVETQYRIDRLRENERLARESATRGKALLEQKQKEHAAVAERAAIRKQIGDENLRVVKQRVNSFVTVARPYVSPVITTPKKILIHVANSGVEKYYVLGTHPSTDSPSFNLLENTFGGQPFTANQAAQVIAVSRQVSLDDALGRLKTMKQYGMIKEGV